VSVCGGDRLPAVQTKLKIMYKVKVMDYSAVSTLPAYFWWS